MLESLLNTAEGVLHPMHVTVIDCYMPLVNCCKAMGDTPAAIKYLSQLITSLDAILGSPTVEVRLL
jgi:SET and MYND domain-containing protein